MTVTVKDRAAQFGVVGACSGAPAIDVRAHSGELAIRSRLAPIARSRAITRLAADASPDPGQRRNAVRRHKPRMRITRHPPTPLLRVSESPKYDSGSVSNIDVPQHTAKTSGEGLLPRNTPEHPACSGQHHFFQELRTPQNKAEHVRNIPGPAVWGHPRAGSSSCRVFFAAQPLL